MEVNSHQSGLKDIFSSRYQQNNVSKTIPSQKPDFDEISFHHFKNNGIEDVFSPTDDYSQIVSIRDKIIGGMKDTSSFLAMARMLKDENIINNNDMIAIDFLAKESPKLDFKVFESISKSDGLSLEMHDLISKVTQKLQAIDGINGNVMSL